MAHGVNARQACGLRGDCSRPSLFPTSSSVSAKAFRLTRLLSVTQQREAGGVTDRGGERAGSDLMDRCGVKNAAQCAYCHVFMLQRKAVVLSDGGVASHVCSADNTGGRILRKTLTIRASEETLCGLLKSV